ncbi:SDR family oxidoreductase [Streptomyces sp. NPDC048106]|uniref:SDR family NAD(P)-dependent oxidoreductase n=1 Tax=Streptomyces sp. NPDC048106 TaxID=3155750 RepID=UPI003456AD1C
MRHGGRAMDERRRLSSAMGADAAGAVCLAEAGMDVAMLAPVGSSRTAAADAIAESGRRSMTVFADLDDFASVESALARVRASFGTPSVLLTVIGPGSYRGPGGLLDQDWKEVVERPLRRAFLAGRASIDSLIKNGWGRVIAVLDVDRSGRAQPHEDAVLRAGLEGLVRTLALELSPFGITSNLITSDRSGSAREWAGARYGSRVADLVGFLVSDEASAVSGRSIPLNDDGSQPEASDGPSSGRRCGGELNKQVAVVMTI